MQAPATLTRATLSGYDKRLTSSILRPALFGSASRNELVGKACTTQLGLEPGDEFEIKLGRKQTKLTPLGAAEEE